MVTRYRYNGSVSEDGGVRRQEQGGQNGLRRKVCGGAVRTAGASAVSRWQEQGSFAGGAVVCHAGTLHQYGKSPTRFGSYTRLSQVHARRRMEVEVKNLVKFKPANAQAAVQKRWKALW